MKVLQVLAPTIPVCEGEARKCARYNGNSGAAGSSQSSGQEGLRKAGRSGRSIGTRDDTMMRTALAALLLGFGAGTQDSAQISALVKKLDSPDWVEQAQAAKELAKIGAPVLPSLRAVMLSDSPSAKYWAS